LIADVIDRVNINLNKLI